MYVTAGQIRQMLAGVADDCPILISIDISEHGDDEEEAGKRVFASDLVDYVDNCDVHGRLLEKTLCFVGELNF